MTPLRWLPLLPPLALLIAAASSDARSRRIPNRITALLALVGWGHAAMAEGAAGVVMSVVAVVVSLLVLCLPLAWGWLGAGDVKLLAAASAWLGLGRLPSLLLLSALAGGVVAAAAYLRAPPALRSAVRANLGLIAAGARPLPSSASGRGALPFGVAIAAAASLLLLAERWGV